jgi:hypothetical protein
MWVMRRALLGLALAFVVACSSDAAKEPEPEIDTPGAFVAFEEAPGQLRTVRVLGGIALDNGTVILFITSYAAVVSSFDAAEELAKSDSPQVSLLSTSIARSEIESHAHAVVWFRTLSDAERELVK